MEELDFLKQHWNKENLFPKINKEEIRRMLHKSSSSIVKWILIICGFEFLLGISLKAYYLVESNYQYSSYEIFFEIIGTVITGIFLVLFIKEYQKIKTFNDTKSLMNSILKTRYWVKMYIFITLGIIVIQFIIDAIQISIFKNFKEGINNGYNKNNLTQAAISDSTIYIILIATFTVIAILLFLYYRFIYIRLLRKLKKNYDELVNLEN